MHHGIISAGIENRSHWPWPSRSFWPFWHRILGNLACRHNNLLWIWARSQNLHQVYILVFSPLVLKMEDIGLDLQGHLVISTKKTAFTSLLYTVLGRPGGATRPKRALVKGYDYQNLLKHMLYLQCNTCKINKVHFISRQIWCNKEHEQCRSKGCCYPTTHLLKTNKSCHDAMCHCSFSMA